MGKRGAKPGNKNAAHGKPWTDALRRALAQYENETLGIKRGQALDRIAENVVKLACVQPDRDVIRELGDRLEGKPKQAIDLDAKVAVVPEVALTLSSMVEK